MSSTSPSKRRPRPSPRKIRRDERPGNLHLAPDRAALAPGARGRRGARHLRRAVRVARLRADLRRPRPAADARAPRGRQDDRHRRHHPVHGAREGDGAGRVHDRAAVCPVPGVGLRRARAVRAREEAGAAAGRRQHGAVPARRRFLLLLRVRQGVRVHPQLRAEVDHAGTRHRGVFQLRDHDVPRLRGHLRDSDRGHRAGEDGSGQRREAARCPAVRDRRRLHHRGGGDPARRAVSAAACHPDVPALRGGASPGPFHQGCGEERSGTHLEGRNLMRALFVIVAFAAASNAFAQLLTEKKFFTLPQYTTVGGKTIKNVRAGYETYGKLTATGDNAVFIAHFFSGTSHAAGRYKADDKVAGYWDAIIGPGKAIDTDKYFVVSADTLVNLNVKNPMVGTTGPATINPDSGRPYGSAFPVVSMRDFVRVHKALIDSLGIRKLKAVAGASGGSVQAMDWAAEYPDFVERVIHVIGPGLDIHPYVIGLLDLWMMPIKLDPHWKGGDYFGGPEPTEGVAQALKTVTLTALD